MRLPALLLAVASPAFAVPVPTTPGLPALAAGEAQVRVIAQAALDKARAGDCPGALALLDPLVAGTATPGVDRNALQLVRLPCLAAAGRAPEAAALQQVLATALPTNGVVLSYGVMMAAASGQFAQAAQRLKAIATGQPDALSLVSGTAWRGIAQKLTEAHETTLRGQVSIALARVDWQPADQPGLRDDLAQDAILALLADRQTSEAGLLLDRIDAPETLFEMATERAYQPLWPAIETKLGPAQASGVDRFARDALDAFSRADGDLHARRDAVRAFVLLGRLDDADALAAPIAVAAGMDEDAVAIVRYHAQVLTAQGRRDAAIARLRPFTTLDPRATPLAGSGLVALAEVLDEAGRPDEALAVARGALDKASDTLSPWGAAWLRRTEACALTTLGRRADAKAVGDLLIAAAADNEAAAIEGSLCAGRSDDAAKIAVATLKTPEGTARLADQFQPYEALWAASPSRLRALWAPLLARADVKAAFERGARILPRPLWPARTPRAIPRAPGRAGAPTT